METSARCHQIHYWKKIGSKEEFIWWFVRRSTQGLRPGRNDTDNASHYRKKTGCSRESVLWRSPCKQPVPVQRQSDHATVYCVYIAPDQSCLNCPFRCLIEAYVRTWHCKDEKSWLNWHFLEGATFSRAITKWEALQHKEYGPWNSRTKRLDRRKSMLRLLQHFAAAQSH